MLWGRAAVATRIPSITAPSGYDLEPLREGPDFTLYRELEQERYRTAVALQADPPRRCLAEWESHRRIDPFPMGAGDSSNRLLIPERLYWREREVERPAFDSAPRFCGSLRRSCTRINSS